MHLYKILHRLLFLVAPGPCYGVVCQNGGACSEGICTCVNGFTGLRCESKYFLPPSWFLKFVVLVIETNENVASS